MNRRCGNDCPYRRLIIRDCSGLLRYREYACWVWLYSYRTLGETMTLTTEKCCPMELDEWINKIPLRMTKICSLDELRTAFHLARDGKLPWKHKETCP